MATYKLGPVRPHVQRAADQVGSIFKPTKIYGFAQRDNASDHPLGLALDFMVHSDAAKGTAIFNYMKQNASQLGVKYLIWQQKIWSVERASEGDRPMPDRGSNTANHMDHVHASFTASGSSGMANANSTSGSNIGCPFAILVSLIYTMDMVLYFVV